MKNLYSLFILLFLINLFSCNNKEETINPTDTTPTTFDQNTVDQIVSINSIDIELVHNYTNFDIVVNGLENSNNKRVSSTGYVLSTKEEIDSNSITTTHSKMSSFSDTLNTERATSYYITPFIIDSDNKKHFGSVIKKDVSKDIDHEKRYLNFELLTSTTRSDFIILAYQYELKGEIPTKYWAEYTNPATNTITKVESDIDLESQKNSVAIVFTIDNLDPSTAYTVKLIAEYEDGEKHTSQSYGFITTKN